MSKQTEALKLALEALEYIDRQDSDRDFLSPVECGDLECAITAIREALADSALERMAENARELGLDYAPAQHDYRIKYDRPCYKCRSNFCPGNCKEPEHLVEQPAQKIVEEYDPDNRTISVYPSEWKAQQKPVATVIKKGAERQWMSERLGQLPDGVYSLYASPPASKPLTDIETEKLTKRYGLEWTETLHKLCNSAIEAKLKEKNT